MSDLEHYAKCLPKSPEDKQVKERPAPFMHDHIFEDRIHPASGPLIHAAPIKPSDRQVGGEHYKKKAIQPWDVIDQGPVQHAIGYYRWNALKYIARAGEKGDFFEDIKKAEHYIQKLIHFIENSGPKVEHP